MFCEYDDSQSQVGTLRIRGAERNDPALRLTVENQIGNVALAPGGLAPSAVFIVCRLSDPLPGRIRSQSPSFFPPRDWERAVREKMDMLYQSALRPCRGCIVGDNDAVLFSDRSELLACLSVDLMRGLAWQRWWWRLIIRSLPATAGASGCLRQLFVDNPRHLPGIVHLLEDWRQAENTLRVLSPQAAADAVTAMLHAHGLSAIADRLFAASPSAADGAGDFQDGVDWVANRTKGKPFPASHPYTAPDRPDFTNDNDGPLKTQGFDSPWRRWLGAHTEFPTLNKEGMCLLGMALVLHRMPWLAHRKAFQETLEQWWGERQMSATDETSSAVDSRIEFVEESSPGAVSEAIPMVLDEPVGFDQDGKQRQAFVEPPALEATTNRTRAPPDETGSKRPSPRGDSTRSDQTIVQPTDPVESGPFVEPPALEATTNRTRAPPDETGSNRPSPRGGSTRSDQTIVQTTDPDESEPFVTDTAISEWTGGFVSTRLGGILYLINLMEQLDLPHCFEPDWPLGSRLSRWALLELLGRALLAKEIDAYHDDDLWRVLAELDGRTFGDPVGEHLIGDDTFRLPPAWFKHIRHQPETFRWGESRGRVRLWSSRGYLLVEKPCDVTDPHAAAATELQRYAKGGGYLLSRAPFAKAPLSGYARLKAAGVGNDLARWLTLAIPAVRYYLCERLALRHAGGKSIVRHLLACPGRIYTTSCHIDFVTDIDNIAIAARRAGLDRNPGWLPEFGRIVQFHFE